MHGTVTDIQTKKPIANTVVDIWEASSNGKYDFQDPENQVPNNLRGKFRTDENGNYHFYCLRPTAYSLPTEGKPGSTLPVMKQMKSKHELTMNIRPSLGASITYGPLSHATCPYPLNGECWPLALLFD